MGGHTEGRITLFQNASSRAGGITRPEHGYCRYVTAFDYLSGVLLFLLLTTCPSTSLGTLSFPIAWKPIVRGRRQRSVLGGTAPSSHSRHVEMQTSFVCRSHGRLGLEQSHSYIGLDIRSGFRCVHISPMQTVLNPMSPYCHHIATFVHQRHVAFGGLFPVRPALDKLVAR